MRKFPVPQAGSRKLRINPLGFLFYEVEHRLYDMWRGQYLAVIGHPLFGFDVQAHVFPSVGLISEIY